MEAPNAKDRLAQAMKTIMHDKSTKQVTVNEIAEKAGLSRQTFYQLFNDKYELISYIWEGEVRKLIAKRAPNEPLTDFWLRFLNIMKADRLFYRNLLERLDEQNSFFFSWIDASLERPIVAKSILRESDDLTFASKLFTYGSNMCIRDWVMNGCKEEPEVMVRQMVLGIPGVLMPYICLGETEYK